MRAAVELREVTKLFGNIAAVRSVSLTVRAGEFLTLLGPSGCGKTTLLRLIAGFEQPEKGGVCLDGVDVTNLPPYRRHVNQVFQSYALFPHLTVRDNIAFGLRMQRLPSVEIATRVNEAIDLVSLGGLENRLPHKLSGGQQQRVALARALAPRPAVLLLDEPLAALDAQLRRAMQLELKQLQRRLGTTFVLVTHDQAEALTMSDRIALMHEGRIEQLDSAQAIYRRPATAFAAEFIGQANLLEAQVVMRNGTEIGVRLAGGLVLYLPAAVWPDEVANAQVVIRPEKIRVTRIPLAGQNTFEARVEEGVFQGANDRLVLETSAGTRLVAISATGEPLGEALRSGDRVWGAVQADEVVRLPRKHA
ncbi:MAG: hypothetical protein RIQ93_2539 [Verrucomicrobiota bacterium]|jgi:spermidine/putrescine transport system ATP-binding protein